MKNIKWIFLICIVLFIYLNNASFLARTTDKKPFLLAHRGLPQTFNANGVNSKTNTATRIFKPEHPYLENTIPSIQAAFEYGADIVEIDIRLTKDKQLAVFHDDVLEYRTNGVGHPEDHNLAELQALDVGYGYTADSGHTYPFRGKGIGLMPSLQQVLSNFPRKSFLIHIKSNDTNVGGQLANYLLTLPQEQLKLLAAYGGEKSISVVKERIPALHVTSKTILKKSLLSYLAIGWTGYIPPSFRNSIIIMPEKYARFLWGWPYRFLSRMEKVNTKLILVKGSGEFSEGFDESADLNKLPRNYSGGIWTNRIDRIGPIIKESRNVGTDK